MVKINLKSLWFNKIIYTLSLNKNLKNPAKFSFNKNFP